MALFDGTTTGRQADDGVRAALAMLGLLEEYNLTRAKSGYAPIEIGIGVNTGLLMLGTLGEQNRMEGTVIGDAVNLAARLESLTKVYGAKILIGENTYESLKDPENYALRFIDRVKVKGRGEPVTVYEVLDADPSESREKKMAAAEEYGQAFGFYREAKFDQAEKLFAKCLKANPEDKALKTFVDRCRKYSERPVPESWDGASRLDSK